MIICGLVDCDALQPDCAPVGRDRTRTVQPATRVLPVANHSLEHNARLLHLEHFSRVLVEDGADDSSDSEHPAAIRSHFLRVEGQTAIHPILINGEFDLLLRLDSNILSRFEVEASGGSRCATLDFALK